MDPYLKEIQTALMAGNATEHTHRPALKTFLESLATGITATNEPKRVACGAPDFIVTRGHAPWGYVEAKDVNTDLSKTEGTPQLRRYLESLGNLVLTDYWNFAGMSAGSIALLLARPQFRKMESFVSPSPRIGPAHGSIGSAHW